MVLRGEGGGVLIPSSLLSAMFKIFSKYLCLEQI